MAFPQTPRTSRAFTTRTTLLGVVAAVVLTACATGPRPFFDDAQPVEQSTGDPAIDAVLDRLETARSTEFTGDYTVLTRLGGKESTATVVQATDGRRAITINDVRFLDAGAVATCNLVTGECEATINDARVSDVQITHDFYGASFARRLRVDAGRRIGESTGYPTEIAGSPAVCADVVVSGGVKVYCALDAGPLGRYDGNDVVVELTEVEATADETAFTTG